MKNFDEKLNKAFARYTETEFSADVPHEYTPENRERAEKILGKTKKETTRRFPMKKRFAAALVCALVLVSSMVVYAASPAVREYINMLFLKEDSVGRLTEIPDGYVGIYTAEDLDNVRNDLNGNYILMNDIVLTADDYAEGGIFEGGFTPIGSGKSPYASQPFCGIFNGNGYVISGLVIDGSYDYAGLFGYTKRIHLRDPSPHINEDESLTVEETNRRITGGIIKNLGLVDSIININGRKYGKAYIGGIAGYADYVIGCYTDNFTITVNLTEDADDIAIGGVVGRAYFVDSCYSTANISFENTEDAEEVYVSGVAGYSFSCVTSYFNGTIDSGDYPDYGVTYCQQYDVPIILTETVMDEVLRRLDEYITDRPNEKEEQERYGHSLSASIFNAFYCSSEYLSLDVSFQNYITQKDEGKIYYLLDPTLKDREYQRLSDLLALAFPNNTFREFCIENHIKSGYYACYDLRDTPDCTFDGFDFDYIWYDRELPKLRLFQEGNTERCSDPILLYCEYLDQTNTVDEPVRDIVQNYLDYLTLIREEAEDSKKSDTIQTYKNGWIKIDN